MNTKNYYCASVAATFKVTQRALRPQPQIKFNFLFKIEHSNYIEYSPTPLFIERRPHRSDSSPATVDVGESLSFEDVAVAVGHAIGNRDERRELSERAWEEVLEKFPAESILPKHQIFYLSFVVEIEHRHVFVVENEVGRGDQKCCCICLDEIAAGGGGGALGMPCSHVFHGGCIKEWLRRSRYCPFCRCEIQME